MDSRIELVNQQRLILYLQPFLYGDFMPLKFKVDLPTFETQVSKFDSNWVIYNKHRGDTGRLGLSLTSLDGGMTGDPDLQSLYQHAKETGKSYSENDFCNRTDAYRGLTCLHELLNAFEGGLGRCRIVKFSAGGFFPPHRDQSIKFQVPDYFRIFVPLQNANPENFYFIYEHKKIQFEPGRAYLFNALKTHSVFSFVNNAYTLALSLKLNSTNIMCAINSLATK